VPSPVGESFSALAPGCGARGRAVSPDSRTEAVARSLEILSDCKAAVDAAEAQLASALAQLEVVARAEKTAVSSAIEGGLLRLREARVRVAEAEATLAREAEVKHP
jgi:hypothetical protein